MIRNIPHYCFPSKFIKTHIWIYSHYFPSYLRYFHLIKMFPKRKRKMITLFVDHYCYHSPYFLDDLYKSFTSFSISLYLFLLLEYDITTLNPETLKRGVSSTVEHPQKHINQPMQIHGKKLT